MKVADYAEIWAVDFEFMANEGRRPDSVCCVAKELRSGRTVRRWRGEFGAEPPYSTGPASLFVAFYRRRARVPLGARLADAGPRILDLYCEFRNAFNGLALPTGRGLIGALTLSGSTICRRPARTACAT